MSHRAGLSSLGRRSFLKSAASAGSALVFGAARSWAQGAAPLLTAGTRTIEVNKKAAKVFSVLGPNGKSGIFATEGDRFSGRLLNDAGEPVQMHWHGQTRAPADQDRARPGGGSLAAGQIDNHDFELTPGSHWMHAHSLSEQRLQAAPMITREKDAGDVQDVVLMLHDFAFRSSQEILAELGGGAGESPHGMAMSQGPGMGRGPGMNMPGMGGGHMMMGMTHANDVRYDAYLANDRTLDDPEVVKVDKGGRVRLRIINGGTATAFFVSTPGLKSRCIAVDGSPCQAIEQATYPIAQGQRVDLLVDVPQQGGAFPVLAQVEAERSRTGLILATAGATVNKLETLSKTPQGLLDLAFETQLRAATALPPKRAERSFAAMLGEQPQYRWTINGRSHGEHQPFDVRQGERVEMTFMNPTSMMHPMHLHGHHFQVVAIGGRRFSGAVRDTVIVPAHAPVTVAFDAHHKGSWFLHCHHLYHMATGMMTELRVS